MTPIIPYSVREEITQTSGISYNSEIYLDSEVFSSSGATGTYIYSSIIGYGTQWPNDYTGYHFEVRSGNHTLSSDKKQCTVTLYGYPQNAYGVILLVELSVTVTFSAN